MHVVIHVAGFVLPVWIHFSSMWQHYRKQKQSFPKGGIYVNLFTMPRATRSRSAASDNQKNAKNGKQQAPRDATAKNCRHSLRDLSDVHVKLLRWPLGTTHNSVNLRGAKRVKMSDLVVEQSAATTRRHKSELGKENKSDNEENTSEEVSPAKRMPESAAVGLATADVENEKNAAEAMEVDAPAEPPAEQLPARTEPTSALPDALETPKTATTGISLKIQSAKEPDRPTPSTDQLATLFSNLYLNSVHRLRANFPPRCAEDLVYCREHHYHQPGPDVPSESLKGQLRCALQQQRYESFVNITMNMCQRREFPGEDTFTMIIELLLSINHTPADGAEAHRLYDKCVELFSYMVRTFPPCWRAMRSAYIGFFQRPLDTVTINSDVGGERLSRATKVFDIVLDLVERALKECSAAELSTPAPDTPSPTLTPRKNADIVSPTEFSSPFPDTQSQPDFNYKKRAYTYIALSGAQRLNYLFMVLRLLLQILESDFVMWLLHHYRKSSSWIFYNDSRPLVVFVLGMSEEAYLSAIGRQIFTLFAIAVNKGLAVERLQVLERYIALLMVVSNTADIEHTVLGVKYPHLGTKTKQLIGDFFRKFKEQNLTASIASYISAIQLLRIPYVRYTFIDQFLQMFDFAPSERFTPEKVLYHMKKKHWQKHRPQAELLAIEEDELSREQYLKLLLDALDCYCQWHACNEVLQVVTNKTIISSIKISTDSVHRRPAAGGGLLMLNKMTADIAELEKQLRMRVRMSKPKIDLPRMDMCIDKELIRNYRSDLKCLQCLQQLVDEQSRAHAELQLSNWQTFLAQYKET